MENNNDLMNRMLGYRFAAYDMLLYLDTHPEDKKAFEMYKELVCRAKNTMAEYEKVNGPLTGFASAANEAFDWLNSSWPWEREANK